ncbi:MAG: UvrB/UvrC motif-containing protein [Clostridia bacterium]|nr:UvrB/UvrC motif-containing protein [Clostridia bacterium]
MKCEKCNQNEATVFYKESVNGKVRSLHLCAACAAEQQSAHPFFSPSYPDNLLGELFGLAAHGKPHRDEARRCPDCGATWSDLLRDGKACCPKCYTAFADLLEPTVRQLHGNVTHAGRAPAARRAVREKESRLTELKRQLQEAVAAENYEQAAKLRDEIRGME